MLIGEINGVAAAQHPAARLFLEEGFATTAMGLQARTERLRPRGFGTSPDFATEDGIGIATIGAGGTRMADNQRDTMSETPQQRRNETSDSEHDRIRSSNDRDQRIEREGEQSEHNRGYDDAVQGVARDESDGEPVDPDSAESDVDRDDMVDE
jgi:hypothetical protein